MLTALATTVLVSAAYGLGPSTTLDYKVDVAFDGFLPILGGNEGKAEVGMTVRVQGMEKDGANLQASNEMTTFSIAFNGSKLPLTIDDAVEYFPKTTVLVTPTGKIVKNDAPNKSLPVKLPGLDVKRFPDITYLPIELPSGEVAVGDSWDFKKSFGGADLNYTCTLSKVDGDRLTVGVKVNQEYTVLENDALEVVQDRKDAVSEVTTTMNGTGKVVFDAKNGHVVSVVVNNKSVSKGENFLDKVAIDRKLDSTLRVSLIEPDARVASVRPVVKDDSPMGHLKALWGSAVSKGQQLWETGSQWVGLAKLALQAVWSFLPGDAGKLFKFGW